HSGRGGGSVARTAEKAAGEDRPNVEGAGGGGGGAGPPPSPIQIRDTEGRVPARRGCSGPPAAESLRRAPFVAPPGTRASLGAASRSASLGTDPPATRGSRRGPARAPRATPP